jgi:hypothetical protein
MFEWKDSNIGQSSLDYGRKDSEVILLKNDMRKSVCRENGDMKTVIE